MSLIMADRVKETSTTTGTGTLSLGGTSTGYQTFVNGIGNGNTCAYLIDDGNGNWEVTWGLVTSGSPATLTRGTLISSSTASRISFAAGTKTVTVVPAAELLLWPANNAALVETDIASATTTDLGTVQTFRARITGTTTITGFGSQPNALRWLRFAGALILTHNATSLILLGGANRTTQAGDVGLYISDASGNWREMDYRRAAAKNIYTSFAGSSPTGTTSATKVLMGLGSAAALTPRGSGRIRLRVCGWQSNATAGVTLISNLYYGTGAAPSNGAALTGSAFLSTDLNCFANSAGGDPRPFTLEGEITGATIGTAYWFDVAIGTSGGTSVLRINSIILEEIE